MEAIAHKNETEIQTLDEHLKNVARLASGFAKTFNNSDWANYAGLFHDFGKADNDWQKYIRGEKSTSVNHSEAGAQYAYSKMNSKDPIAKVIPYLIAGHHAGLPDYSAGSGNSLKSILQDYDFAYLDKLHEWQ
ncbi:CRISPR-associated endonuclease Cas3'' [uncultured Treponema sp.]|uniref:CRISPR-associated endonuclease Cas3'' n=1 Tax=uncultured Treponema sp. TaxID=162155 RepID=UPI0025E89A0A|nr:CRISPR-associated endonuclease Cas3'' [uncultured Treponema sp.]